MRRHGCRLRHDIYVGPEATSTSSPIITRPMFVDSENRPIENGLRNSTSDRAEENRLTRLDMGILDKNLALACDEVVFVQQQYLSGCFGHRTLATSRGNCQTLVKGLNLACCGELFALPSDLTPSWRLGRSTQVSRCSLLGRPRPRLPLPPRLLCWRSWL